jgi:hypothetical protein
MSDSGQIPAADLGQVTLLNEDSMKILEEASAIVEESTKDKFPDLPSTNINTKNREASLF